MIALVVLLAAGTPVDNHREEAARAEAEAFADLDAHHDCDAAAAFLRAFALAPDDRLLMNAALAYQRAGDADAARGTLARIVDADILARAAASMKTLAESSPPARACVAPQPPPPSPPPPPPPPSSPPPTAGPSPVLLGTGIAALAVGVVLGGGTAGGAALRQSVLYDARATTAQKDSALQAVPWLVATGAVAGVLVAAGGVLVPVAVAGGG